MRSAISWQYGRCSGYAPYLAQHESPLLPHSTARARARLAPAPRADGARRRCTALCGAARAREHAGMPRGLCRHTPTCRAGAAVKRGAQRRHARPYHGIRLTGKVRAAPPSQLRDTMHAAHAVRASGRPRACHVGSGDEEQAAVGDRLHGGVEQVRRRAEGVQVNGLVRGGVLRAYR
jgi:hypothetical protein